MVKVILAILCSLVSCLALANNPTKTLHFNDNSSVTLVAATNNINRLFVKGDKIIQHIAPQGTFVFDSQRSKEGSLYFKPIYLHTPFSIFFATAKGHHFSALVVPVQANGKTIEMIPNQVITQPKQLEKDANYLSLLQNRLLRLIQGKATNGQVIKEAKTQRLAHGLQVRLMKMVSMPPLTGLVYQLTNTSNQPLHIVEQQFWRPGVRAVSISNQVIPAHHSAQLDTLIGQGGE